MHSSHQIILFVFILSLFVAGCALGESLFPKATPTPILAASPPADAQPGDLWTSSVDGMTLVLIPAGEFIMGSDDGDVRWAAARAVVGHDQKASGDVRVTVPLVLLPILAEHLAAFSRSCSRVRPIVMADDGLLDLGRNTDIALRATRNPPEAAIGRDLMGLAWGHYAPASTRSEADPGSLPWVQFLDMDPNHPAIAWRRRYRSPPRWRKAFCFSRRSRASSSVWR